LGTSLSSWLIFKKSVQLGKTQLKPTIWKPWLSILSPCQKWLIFPSFVGWTQPFRYTFPRWWSSQSVCDSCQTLIGVLSADNTSFPRSALSGYDKKPGHHFFHQTRGLIHSKHPPAPAAFHHTYCIEHINTSPDQSLTGARILFCPASLECSSINFSIIHRIICLWRRPGGASLQIAKEELYRFNAPKERSRYYGHKSPLQLHSIIFSWRAFLGGWTEWCSFGVISLP